ncbi:hypothetical protein SETIT_7G066600v2 [Setaria italica]|uniref:Uncharacterized protein n=1 Tax=Setaria italica TaxID=4555 RepID=A0A368RSW4_SETIT|nr:hypothetical protein SETIT_7G066600v2 [Setaria italica]
METLVQAHTSPNVCKHAHRAPSVHTTDKCSFTLLFITHGNPDPPEARRAAAGQNRPFRAGLARIWQHRRGVVIAPAVLRSGGRCNRRRPASGSHFTWQTLGRRHGPPPAAGGRSATPGLGSKRPRPGGHP